MPKFFHYTTMPHLEEIEKDGFLKLVESNVSLEKAHAGPDVVWLFAESLNTVPKMMFSPLMKGDRTKSVDSASWTGFVISKAQVELEITLDKSEVTRADKFLKKNGASKEDMKSLESSGGYKLTKQYVTTEKIDVERITGIKTRKDLVQQIWKGGDRNE